MMRALLAALAVAAITASPYAAARGSHSSGSHSSGSHSSGSHHSASHAHQGRAYAGVKRDAHGKIARDPHAKEAFRRSHFCPATGKAYGACPGRVVDHVQALKHGGADDPSNMQWQTRAAAKAKDRWE
jgi:hypothetical protein